MALGTGQRSVQRTLDALAAANKADSFGRGRTRRWMTPPMPGFPTSLLLPPSFPDNQNGCMKRSMQKSSATAVPLRLASACTAFGGRHLIQVAENHIQKIDGNPTQAAATGSHS
jgi:hypothetical protein